MLSSKLVLEIIEDLRVYSEVTGNTPKEKRESEKKLSLNSSNY